MGDAYQPLTGEQRDAIHETSLRLLEEVGLEVNHEGARGIFKKAGARVDEVAGRVYLPRDLVMENVERAPSKVVLCGRDPANDLVLEDGRVYLGTGGTALNVLDLETGEKRPSTMQDVKDTARLVDALENIAFLVLPLYPTEFGRENVDVNRFFGGLSNTTKHVMGGIYTREGALEVIKMAELIAGGADRLRERPFVSMITCVMSPLKMDDTYTELLITVAEQGIPLAVPAEPLCGSTSPVTLAGNVAQMNAETLAGVVLTQLVNPGTPAIYGSVATISDMRTMGYLSGAVEMGLINAAGAQMARYYGLPYYATAGMSDSKVPDVQAGYEKAMTAVLVALAGANYIHDAAGLLEFAMTVSYEQYVIDDEIIGMALRAVRGIEVNEDTLAYEVIKKVGPGGNYLSEPHTVRHMRSEFFYPKVADRRNRARWEAGGATDARERARTIARELLAEHRPEPVPDDVVAEIREKVKGFVL